MSFNYASTRRLEESSNSYKTEHKFLVSNTSKGTKWVIRATRKAGFHPSLRCYCVVKMGRQVRQVMKLLQLVGLRPPLLHPQSVSLPPTKCSSIS